MDRAFNKKVKPRNLKEGNLVLKKLRAPVFDPRGKFKSNWAGPCHQDFVFKWSSQVNGHGWERAISAI